MAQSKRWCFTINNFAPSDVARLDGLGECKYIIYGKERGESGTPHLQGFVIFEVNKRFNNVKQLLGDRCHVEVARGTSAQAAEYCRKDGDFVERGTPPNAAGKRTDWERYRSWVQSLGRIPTRRELAAEYTSLYARYDRKCFEIAELCLPAPELQTGDLRPGFQTGLADTFGGPAPPRAIDFIVDAEGNSGKSWFCGYCFTRWPERVQVLSVGKRDDLAYAIDCNKDIFLFDVPRTQMIHFQYSVLEMLKNRMVFSSKYESRMKVLAKLPHVAVFCNEAPDREKLSHDRFRVTTIRQLN